MEIEKKASLSLFTTIKTGGLCDYLIRIKTKEDLLAAFDFINKEKLNFFCLGGGSNLLINDAGFKGVVLKMENNQVFFQNDFSVAESGILITELIILAKSKNLGGLEWAFPVPATLGGALRNNLGAFSFDLSKIVEEITFFDWKKNVFSTLKGTDCLFSYRKSIFSDHPNWVIFSAKIRWTKMDRKKIELELIHFLNKRRSKQPLEYPSSGSFFRNPSIENLSKEKKAKLINDFILSKNIASGDEALALEKDIWERQTLPAGYFIERLNLKGKKIGGAQISEKHANFLINYNNAKTEDIIILSSVIKEKVRNRFDIQLHEEVQYIGF